MFSSSVKFLTLLLWIASVYTVAIYIFTSGFLLRRQVLTNRTECTTRSCNQPPAIFQKAVVILIDALKYDFCVHNSSVVSPKPYQNKMPIFNILSKPDPVSGLSNGKLFKFIADPPTTTMQRLKGLTTGSLPTFIDVSSNFASYEITEDNIIDQMVKNNKRVVFAGDDTWTSLYPESFTKTYPLPSFDVWDLDTVDKEVKRVLYSHLRTSNSWDVFIGHFLGVDHAGHKFGPSHPEMTRKLKEMNLMIEHTAKNLPEDTLLLVFGDHGMTQDGDHGGDSDSEINAGLFAYSPKLGLRTSTASQSVAQIDIVPTLSLLLGVPIPFSNLGAIIEDLFVPTALIKDTHINGQHARQASYSSDNLMNFRLSYIKSNVHQVYRYLTAYLAQGGTFPEQANSKIRTLASQVINRPGALSYKQIVELFNTCKIFLEHARSMCQSVWVEFNLSAMGHGLNILFLHTSVLMLLILKPGNRMLSHLVSCTLIASSLFIGAFIGVSFSFATGTNFYTIVPGCAVSLSVLVQGFALLWKLRQSLIHIVKELLKAFNYESLLTSSLFLATLLVAFSNSFVILKAQTLNFLLISLVISYLVKFRHLDSVRKIPCLAILMTLGVLRLSSIYVRCREEQGSECPQTDFHKPLSTLPLSAGQIYKNWRYFFSLVSLFLTCLSVHSILSRGGNLNGVSVPVLTARYFPWVISMLIAGYWALQAFPTALISKLLPWQQNLLAQLVLFLCVLGIVLLVINPKLVYLIPKKRRLNQMVPKQENVATYFNFIKANWKTTLSDRPSNIMPVAYGLGTALSATVLSITTMFSLLSMLLSGDGQCPAIFHHLLGCILIIVFTTPLRLISSSNSTSLFRVPFPCIFLWYLLDSLAFFNTGHQPTFPHIQWSAAFVGFAGTEFGGDSWLSHLVPIVLVGWNTFSTAILSGIALPLLLLAPPCLWLLIPSLRPERDTDNEENGDVLTGEDIFDELQKGEAVFLDREEETRGAMLILVCQYIVLKASKLFSAVLAAAVLRRHLMVWKIFAPNFIFEAVSFCVSLASVITGFLMFNRILSVMSRWYTKIQKS